VEFGILKECIQEYRQLKQLQDIKGRSIDARQRGILLEKLFQKVLSAHGVTSDIRLIDEKKDGEVDLYFRTQSDRLLVSIKWEKSTVKVNDGPVTQLFGRIEARKAGRPIGIVISMSGFTELAMNTAKSLGIILLDRTFFEAMLVGFVEVESFFNLLLLPHVTKYVDYNPTFHKVLQTRAKELWNSLIIVSKSMDIKISKVKESIVYQVNKQLSVSGVSVKDKNSLYLHTQFGLMPFDIKNIRLRSKSKSTIWVPCVSSICYKPERKEFILSKGSGIARVTKSRNSVDWTYNFVYDIFVGNTKVVFEDDRVYCLSNGSDEVPPSLAIIDEKNTVTEKLKFNLNSVGHTSFVIQNNVMFHADNSGLDTYDLEDGKKDLNVLKNIPEIGITNPRDIIINDKELIICNGNGRIHFINMFENSKKKQVRTLELEGRQNPNAVVINNLLQFFCI